MISVLQSFAEGIRNILAFLMSGITSLFTLLRSVGNAREIIVGFQSFFPSFLWPFVLAFVLVLVLYLILGR